MREYWSSWRNLSNIPFVPPIDVATGTPTEVDLLKKRYWTIFDPDAFARLTASGAGPFSRKSGAEP